MIDSQSAPPASSPAPRRTARSMLSLGTELPFAFWIASARVGLPAGSPPPVRAATSTFLTSLANSLPRRASTTAFLCLVVAHFEWPLTGPPPPSPSTRTAHGPARLPSSRDGTPLQGADPAARRRSYRRQGRRRPSRAPRRLARNSPPRAPG